MLVQVVLFDGFDPLDVVAPYEILGQAMTAELVSAEGAREVPSGNGLLTLRAESRLARARGHRVMPRAAWRTSAP